MPAPFVWWAGRDPQPLHASPVHHIHHLDGLDEAPHVEPAAPVRRGSGAAREPQHFQARPAEVDQLLRLADSGEVAVIGAVTGQRGVGKTQVAGVYARRRIAAGWSVAWIPGTPVLTGALHVAIRAECGHRVCPQTSECHRRGLSADRKVCFDL